MITLKQPRGLTATLSNAGVIGVASGTTYTFVEFQYALDGKVFTNAAVTGGASPTVDQNTGAAFVPIQPDKGCVFVFCVNAAGAESVAQGPITAIDGTTDEFLAPDAPQFPYISDDYCPFGYFIVQTAGTSSAWTFGASNWDATGVTAAEISVSTLPTRPPTDATVTVT